MTTLMCTILIKYTSQIFKKNIDTENRVVAMKGKGGWVKQMKGVKSTVTDRN